VFSTYLTKPRLTPTRLCDYEQQCSFTLSPNDPVFHLEVTVCRSLCSVSIAQHPLFFKLGPPTEPSRSNAI
jgi:hypothetical protein